MGVATDDRLPGLSGQLPYDATSDRIADVGDFFADDAVLKTADRRLAGKVRIALGSPSTRQRKRGIGRLRVGIIGVLAAAGDPDYPLAQHIGNGVTNVAALTRIDDLSGHRICQTNLPVLASSQKR